MRVDVVEARPADVPVLRRLMQLYLYELFTIAGWDIGADGVYGSAQRTESFWTGGKHRSFFITADGKLAGFVIVGDQSHFAAGDARQISEFFVLRAYRRRGVGRQAATRVFDMFPGKWEVIQLARNVEAQAFWRAVIDRYTGGRFEDLEQPEHDWAGRIQFFETPVPPAG
jgi:predicted acetyltransferase